MPFGKAGTVLDTSTAEFLEGGCALIVGTVSSRGEPRATRGWGLTVLPDGATSVRLLLAADDAPALRDLGADGRVAITAADVPTARSIQLKGRCVVTDAATPDDETRARRYMDAFFGDVVATDGTARWIVERVVPVGFVACTVTIEELYDQTPGPRAGSAIGGVGP